MAKTVDFDRFVAACDYPGVLDEAVVTASLQQYLSALGVVRQVRRLPADWDIATEEPLRRTVAAILDEFAKRTGRKPALDARDARAALDALAARDALDARAARAALLPLSEPARAGALHRFAQWCVQRGAWWWSFDLSWMATTLIGAQQLGRDIPWTRPLFEAYVAGAWFLYWTEDTLYWVSKPVVHMEPVDGWRRLHCEDGPAVESDVENLYFWHGVLVPAFAVTHPHWITVKHVQDEENAEVRRVLIERMGWDRWLSEQGATPVHSDRFGDLYRTELNGGRLGVVVVTNSTPEPSGHFKKYALLVPPEMESAHQAVASTFGLSAEQYQPAIET